LRIRNARQYKAASRSARIFVHEEDACSHGVSAHRRYLRGPWVNIAYSRSHFENAQCDTVRDRTRHAARVHKHHVFTCDHGGHICRVNLGGPGGEYCLFEVPFCECAMRGSPRPHPALLESSCTKRAYAVTADMPIVGISEGLG